MFCFPCLCHEESATAKDKQDMITELNVMKGLKPHPHVVKLIGCCSLDSKSHLRQRSFHIVSEGLNY